MSRPRKAEDPIRWPVPCGRCGQHHQSVARWPDGGVCGYCYQQAKRTRGVCECGHEGVLPGIIDEQPACRSCSGVRLNVDCEGCGAEDELYTGGRCWTCVLGDVVDNLLTNPDTGSMATELIPLAAALKSMKRANSGMPWIRQKHVTAFLRTLAAAPAISHEIFDELPDSRTREYVRGLLIEHGVLPQRDAFLLRYDSWAAQALERVSDPQNLDVARRYIRWHHQRRMNLMDEVTRGTYLRAKQEVTVAIDLLNWLTSHDVKLSELQQSHLDVWQAEGPTTRRIAGRFLKWAINTKAAPLGLTIVPHRRGTSPRLAKPGQDQALKQVIHDNGLETRDRAAAILILFFGQQAENIARLTWDDVTITEELVTIQLGTIQIGLPDPLDKPWRELSANPGHDLTASHPNTRWVFRGASPGRHIHPGHLTTRLGKLFSTRAARLGTLHELTKLAPVAIIAETLGYSPTTIERHAIDSAAAYAQYMAAAHQQRTSQTVRASDGE